MLGNEVETKLLQGERGLKRINFLRARNGKWKWRGERTNQRGLIISKGKEKSGYLWFPAPVPKTIIIITGYTTKMIKT